jgi:hypothetical protein
LGGIGQFLAVLGWFWAVLGLFSAGLGWVLGRVEMVLLKRTWPLTSPPTPTPIPPPG